MSRESKADVMTEARKRFERCQEFYGESNRRFLEDLKFANGDSDNQWQWPNQIYQDRLKSDSPTLTINKVRQHNLQIVNDAKQNKPSITIRPTGGGATYEASQTLEGICRHIEYQSNAQAIYDQATGFQVQAGVGYWRVGTDYDGAMSFDQEIFIQPIADPLGVFVDPDCKEPDKSDMEFAFIFEDIPRDRFDRDYPEFAGQFGDTTLSSGGDDWIGKDHVRRCEYFRKVVKEDWLIQGELEGQPIMGLGKMLPENVRQKLLELAKDPSSPVKARRTQLTTIEWKYIFGDKVVDEKIWLGETIPIVAVIGEETFISGHYDRKGHTRALKDAQRIYNYSSSAAVEYGALQTKVPWSGPAQVFEGYENYWNFANKRNWPYLPWNHVDDNGQPLPAPIRVDPPVASPFFAAAMQTSTMEMMMASGQYESQMGEQGNERSAKAISERQRQGDNATYHYIDNLALAIRRTGKIILDLIPKVYDTERIIMILAKDGETLEVKIDPQAKMAFQMQQLEDAQTAQRILNPNVGKYEVQADIGPAYSTQRQQAFDAFTTIITQAPTVAAVIGDLMFRAADFPMADEAAIRLKRMAPPQALGQGPTQNEQTLMQQAEAMKGVMTEMINEIARLKLELKTKDREASIGEYKAITERLDVVGESGDNLMKLRDNVNLLVDQMLAERAAMDLEPPPAGESSPESPGTLNTRMGMEYGNA